jgi:hypothetical protein
MVEPEVLIYPDSNRVGLFAATAPGGARDKRTLQEYLRADAEVGYYGEQVKASVPVDTDQPGGRLCPDPSGASDTRTAESVPSRRSGHQGTSAW